MVNYIIRVAYHTPQSLRASSSILEEQMIHSKLFSSNSHYIKVKMISALPSWW